jgi:hypothetical protein
VFILSLTQLGDKLWDFIVQCLTSGLMLLLQITINFASVNEATVTHSRNESVPCKYELPLTAVINPLHVLYEQGADVREMCFYLNI